MKTVAWEPQLTWPTPASETCQDCSNPPGLFQISLVSYGTNVMIVFEKWSVVPYWFTSAGDVTKMLTFIFELEPLEVGKEVNQFPPKLYSEEEGINIKAPNKLPLNSCGHFLNLYNHCSPSHPQKREVIDLSTSYILHQSGNCLIDALHFNDINFLLLFLLYIFFFLLA